METITWSEYIHNIGMAVMDGPHVFEVHTLRGILGHVSAKE
jgi:hypothetical protein